MSLRQGLEIRTVETRLRNPNSFEILEQVLRFFASLRHKIWRDLVVKKIPINELKKSYIREFEITARHFNSLVRDVTALEKSRQEINRDSLKSLQTKISSLSKSIVKLENRIRKIESTLKAIVSYRLKIAEWKKDSLNLNRVLKKPKGDIVKCCG